MALRHKRPILHTFTAREYTDTELAFVHGWLVARGWSQDTTSAQWAEAVDALSDELVAVGELPPERRSVFGY